jgi:uncharacterized protein YicC (UPF0701 family)
MKKVLIALLAGFTLALPLAGIAAPDEAQKALMRKAQEAKKKLTAAQAASGAERQKMMQEHMKMMQDMMAQAEKAKPRAGMSADQKGEWMQEHMKVMHEMMSQMMGQQQMMMQGMGGMGGGGMGGK